MSAKLKLALASLIVLSTHLAFADEKVDVGPNIAAQYAADSLRSVAGTDIGLIHAGFLKDSYNPEDLSSWLNFPTDEIAILRLSGDEVKQALELGVSLYPEANKSFLQVSGLDIVFKKSGSAGNRIVSVSVNGVPLQGKKTYSVAVPSILAHGAVGYFRVWGTAKIEKIIPGKTVEDVLKKKRASEGVLRWSALG
jgi:2',3'-cyclic-nucleotide 2'-phosphodiesterase (5'-nucleotidase family)